VKSKLSWKLKHIRKIERPCYEFENLINWKIYDQHPELKLRSNKWFKRIERFIWYIENIS